MNARLRALRKQKGWTQEEAAALIGIKKDQYGKIETGKSKGSKETIAKLAELYGTSVEYITYSDERMTDLFELFQYFSDEEQDRILDNLRWVKELKKGNG